MNYKVYDSLGKYLRSFSSYEGAMTYKIMCHRMDWKIVKSKIGQTWTQYIK